MKKVLIFYGLIDSLDAFAQELAQGFQQQKHQVKLVNVKSEEMQLDLFEKYIGDTDTIVVFLNNIGLTIREKNGDYYWKSKRQIQCIDIVVDPPVFYHEIIDTFIDTVNFLCVDAKHSAYINRFYGKKTGAKTSYYLPLAGIKNPEVKLEDIRNIKKFKNRSMDVVFTGNYRNFQEIDIEMDECDKNLIDLWMYCYGFMQKNLSVTLDEAVEMCLKQMEIQLSEEQLLAMIRLFKRMDSVMRSRYREKVISCLVESGIKVDVFGDGWQEMPCVHRENLLIHAKVSYEESVRLLKDAKISFNTMPWFKAGFHDRIPTAMLAGCISVTDSSLYIEQNFINGKDIILYDLSELSKLPDKIAEILSDSFRYHDIVCNAYEKASLKHTWVQRAERILEICQ